MHSDGIPRRTFLGTAAVAAGALVPGHVQASDEGGAFEFEVTRSEDEWREMLSDAEFDILRGGGTEPAQSSPLWEETRPGIYCCKGCELTLYDGHWKKVLEMGWVFFRHSEPHTVMTAIDRPNYEQASSGTLETTMAPDLTDEEIRALDSLAGVEAICRRCGSHLGHIVSIENNVLHCINGTALDFQPSEA